MGLARKVKVSVAKVLQLETDTAAYYDGLSAADKADDAAWATASSQAARKRLVDLPAAPTRRPPPGRRR